MLNERQGLIVWFQHRKNIRTIKKYGHLIYVSKKMRFAVIYVNQDEIEAIESEIVKLPFVKKVQQSYRPFIDTKFENSKLDEAKIYDYK